MAVSFVAPRQDITFATAESSLLLTYGIETINWRDKRSGTFQKNLTNRRGDLLLESVTLHRRFPYAVLNGFFILDAEAEHDGSDRRESTFANAHQRLQLFTGRDDPGGRDEQYERLYVGLVDAIPEGSTLRLFEAGKGEVEVSLEEVIQDGVELVREQDVR